MIYKPCFLISDNLQLTTCSSIKITCIHIKFNHKSYCLHSLLQKNHTGVNGRTGLFVVRSAEVEYLTGRGNASHQNVHTLILHTTNVMELITKRRNAMNNVAQVC